MTAAVVLACVFTYPYIINFSNAGRLDTNDGRWSIWVVSWVAHALTTDPLQLIFAPTSSIPTQRAGLLGGKFCCRRHGDAGVAADAESVRHAQLRLHLCAFVLSSSTTYYLVRRLTGDRRAGDPRGNHVRVLPVCFRASGAHPAVADRLPAVVHAGVASVYRSHEHPARHRAWRRVWPDRPGVRVLRHFRGRDDRHRLDLVRLHAGRWKDLTTGRPSRSPPSCASD